MSLPNNSERCKQCGSVLGGAYCSSCGQPAQLRRIDGAYILAEIGSVLNFNKGILYTIRELLLRPGLSVRRFINEDRNRLVKPVVFLIICSLVYSVSQQVLRFEDGYINFNFDDWEDTSMGALFQWITNNYGYANILMAVFIALWIKILFRKYTFNFYETLILLCFIMGMSMLIFSIFGIIESLSKLPVLQFGANIGIFYSAWAIARFFDPSKKRNYLKGFLSYLLGMITFIFSIMGLGAVLDLII